MLKKLALAFALMSALSTANTLAKAPKADNSEQNKGATQQNSVTAEKQDNKKSDVEALAEIRKSIVGDKELSMDAKNVKILYTKGAVTLRGPVDSEEEKSKVESLAKSCSCVTSVKNLVTISPKKH